MPGHILLTTIFLLCTSLSTASAFTITSQLTGDLRLANPDGMVVDVTINVDEVNSPYTANWIIDLNSPVAHPNMKLDAFYFNLDPDINLNNISFANVLPAGWYVSTSSGTSGVGGVVFDYESDKSKGSVPDVTNSQTLSFDMIATFILQTSDFLDAELEIGNDNAGSGQLGAHVQSLVMGIGNRTDSGFVFGNYETDGGGGSGGGTPVPEPSTLILLGVGMVGLAVFRRKQN